MASNESIRAAEEEKKLLERIEELTKRINTLNEKAATATGQRKTFLENLINANKQEISDLRINLKLNEDILETERLKTEAAKDTLNALNQKLETESLAKEISDDIAKAYDIISQRAERITSLAADNATQVKIVSEFNTKLVEIESVRNDLIKAIRTNDEAGVATSLQKMTSLQSQANALASNANLTDEQRNYMVEILGISKEITKESAKRANLTKTENSILKGYLDDADSLREKVQDIAGAVVGFLKSPSLLIGAALIEIGKLATKAGEVNKKLGTTFSDMSEFSNQTRLMSLFFDDAAETALKLAERMGDTRQVSGELIRGTTLLANNIGVSGETAATVVTQFGKLSGNSNKTALNMAASVAHTAKLKGLNPGKIFEDIAQNSEAIAKFTDMTAEGMSAASMASAKMGVGLETSGAIAESMLDFEGTLERASQASATLGKNFDLSGMQQAAFSNNIPQMLREMKKLMPTEQEFKQLNPLYKDTYAKMFGISVPALQQMVYNSKNLNENTDLTKKNFSETEEAIKGMSNAFAGGFFDLLGKAVIGLGGIKVLMDGLKTWKAGGGIKDFFTRMTSFGSSKTPETPEAPTTGGGRGRRGPIPRDSAGRFTSTAPAGPKSSTAANFLAAAVAMIAFAAAIYILAKAFQEFDKVKEMDKVLLAFGASVLGMVVLLGIAALAGTALEPILIPLALVLIAFGASILLAAAGFYIAAKAFEVFANAIGIVGKNLPILGEGLIGFAKGITAFVASPFIRFGAGLVGLAASFTLFALASPFIILGAIALSFLGNAISQIPFEGFSKLAKGITEFANAPYMKFSFGILAIGYALSIFGLLSPAIKVGSAALVEFSNSVKLFAPGLDLLSQSITKFADSPYVQFGVAMAAIVFELSALGVASGLILAGAGALTAVSTALGSLSNVMPAAVESLSMLSQISYSPIYGLAGALGALAASLTAVSVAGAVAIPVLSGLSLVNGVVSAAGGVVDKISAGVSTFFGGEKETKDNELINEIKGLRADLSSGKIAVHMDGYKLTAAVAASNAKTSLTKQ